jgi:hypothetical protein
MWSGSPDFVCENRALNHIDLIQRSAQFGCKLLNNLESGSGVGQNRLPEL